MTASALNGACRGHGALSAALRAATRAMHDEIEASMPLLDVGLTFEVYLQHLQALLPAVRAAERLVQPWHEALMPWVGDRAQLAPRAPRLCADIALLTRQTMFDADRPGPPSPSLLHAVGSWYVLSGARLGGQLIARRVNMDLRLQESTGLAYYGACAPSDGRHFRAFLRAIDAQPNFVRHREQVIEGALHTFALFHRSLLGR